MKEEGIVVQVGEGFAVVEVGPREECHKCASCAAARPRRLTVSGEDAEGLAVGDPVEVEIACSSMMRVYLLLYAVPLAAFVGAVFVLHAITRSPVISFIGALAATVIAYMCVGLCMRRKGGVSPEVHVIKSKIKNQNAK